MKQILVPTDFSKTAFQALQFALDIVSVYEAEIKVLHVIELPVNTLSEYPLQYDLLKEMSTEASSSFNTWSEGLPGDFTFEVLPFSVVSGIERYIKEHPIDLVVMGTHGTSGLSEFFVGSNTEKIVRLSKVPVFSIKKSVKVVDIKNIVFPTELTLSESNLVNKIKELQKKFSAHLHILYVNTPTNFKTSKDIASMMEDYIAHYGFDSFSTKIIDEVYEQAGIMEFTNDLSRVVIAMATHSRRGLAHFFRGSIAENLVNRQDCPIWTYSIKQ